MRKQSVLMLAALVAIPFAASADPPSTTRIFGTGFGVASVVHHEADGVVTEGYLFGVNVLHGERPDVPWPQALVFFGTRYDPALGYPVTFLGGAPVTYTSGGLASARLTGTVHAEPFYDGSNLPPEPLPPIEIAVDLTFTGVGATHANTAHFAMGSPGSAYVFVDATRWRYADVSGSATVDGSAATVDTAQLLASTFGEFNLVAQP